MDIRFRHISINTGNSEASGFVLCYDSLRDAQELFTVLMSAYKNRIRYKTILKFQKSNETEYNMMLLINGGDRNYQVLISGIDHIYIDMLCDSIGKNGFIFILTAQSRTEQELNLVQSGYLCVSRFYINDTLIEGHVDNTKFPIDVLENFVRY